ncbi:MAG: AAA family ATPase [Candidatus Zixiibacteriota bacterium]
MDIIAKTTSKKILISGVFASGKSTLVKKLTNRLVFEGIKVNTVGEIPRRCPFALNQNQTTLASAWLIGEQIKAEVEESIGNYDLLICDRAIPDIFSHSIVLKREEKQATLSTIISLAKAWSNTYDLVFWAKADPNLPIETDGVRVPDKKYQFFLEKNIEKAFAMIGISPKLLPQKTEDRIEYVCSKIYELLDK